MRYDDFYKTIYKELHKKGFLITRDGVKRQLLGHPFYPSIQAVSDYLADMDIPNSVVRIDFNQLKNTITEGEVIALVRDEEGDNLLWIKEIKEDLIEYSDHTSDTIAKFLDIWKGVCIIMQPDIIGAEDYYNIDIQRQRAKTIWGSVIFAGFVLMLFIYFLHNFLAAYDCILLSLNAIGLVFCILLLTVELGFKSDFTKKLCSLSSDKGCEKVAHSKMASFKHLISLADIGFIYFVSIILYQNIGNSYLLAYIALLCIPAILFSVLYQTIKIKAFCPLCLSVMLVLSFDIVVYFLNGNYSNMAMSHISVSDILSLCSISFMFGGVWLLVKILIRDKNGLETFQYQYLRLLQRPNRIKYEVQCLPQEILDSSEYTISLGNKNASLTIMEVMNPYCIPCGFSMNRIARLIDRFENGLQVQIRFISKKNNLEKNNLIIRHLLSFAKENDSQKTMSALLKWYSLMDFEEWTRLFPVKSLIDEDVLLQYFAFGQKMGINHTPTIFINGRRMDGEVSLDNLAYYIEDTVTE